ncbi:MAG: SOS response-associated peptidase [Candidatus Nitrohelix vancouverensis]|uniref:Abasic site processing protein n=1 Tax=Candidatus Nitrohelix vancouverensis TaxID=2705534 RepID=A0A7T0C4F7_9BACT|nr:MAG: SOS response-associated peptidase [Candidatus Nitrohelix vancouverensis]
MTDHFSVAADTPQKKRFNIAPTQYAPVAISSQGQRALQDMRWGLVPNWARDASIAHKLINARSETAHEKPSFKESFKRRRCLIPTDGFIEWQGGQSVKRPHHIFLPGREIFCFAGIWSQWDSGGETLITYSILTRPANEQLQALHHRMPVVVRPENYDEWIDPDAQRPALSQIIDRSEDIRFTIQEISTRVNSAKNDDPDCLRPVPVNASLF